MKRKTVKVPRRARTGGMAKKALKKGGGAKLGKAGTKVDRAAANSLNAPRPPANIGKLGAAGTDLGGTRKRARDKRLQNAQL